MLCCEKKHVANHILGQTFCRKTIVELLIGDPCWQPPKRAARGNNMGLLTSYMRQMPEQELEKETVTLRECGSLSQQPIIWLVASCSGTRQGHPTLTKQKSQQEHTGRNPYIEEQDTMFHHDPTGAEVAALCNGEFGSLPLCMVGILSSQGDHNLKELWDVAPGHGCGFSTAIISCLFCFCYPCQAFWSGTVTYF